MPCSDWFDQRDQALLAHATQIDPDGAWFRVPRDLQVSVWPTEDYEAALSYVPIEPIEDDLFAGIPRRGHGRPAGHRAATSSWPTTVARRGPP